MADSESRLVLGHGGNKARMLIEDKNPISKPLKKAGELEEVVVDMEDKNGVLLLTRATHASVSVSVPSILRRHKSLCSSSSLNASYSSDASMDSSHSRASTGRMYRASSKSSWKKPLASKPRNGGVPNSIAESLSGDLQPKRCAWAAATTDPSYVAFHDEEWGVPEHDDNKLFEFLILSLSLAELTWPAILSKRRIFREVFADFDPIAVAKLNEKKITEPGSLACSLLSELKLRSIIENARQVSKVIDEFGSLNKYVWSFVNNKPIVSSFRHPRQLPVKTSKADLISKDLVRRGFRGVGPTVVYSFMQVAGITNDHLVNCFRFHECSKVKVEKEP